MTYLAQDQLTYDPTFGGRVRSSVTEQSVTFKDDARPDFVALANACLRGESEPLLAFNRLVAAAPGFDDQADTGEGTIDQSQIPDPDILAAVQAGYPTVVGLFYDDTGAPVGGV